MDLEDVRSRAYLPQATYSVIVDAVRQVLLKDNLRVIIDGDNGVVALLRGLFQETDTLRYAASGSASEGASDVSRVDWVSASPSVGCVQLCMVWRGGDGGGGGGGAMQVADLKRAFGLLMGKPEQTVTPIDGALAETVKVFQAAIAECGGGVVRSLDAASERKEEGKEGKEGKEDDKGPSCSRNCCASRHRRAVCVRL
jgi:hypothetical protein